ncbi:MAG: M15 family metallopeptidase [Clostridium sp.]|nr:M15 family metallopeptidase [Clostridium sp.]
MEIAKKNRLLKYPALLILTVVLIFYYIGRHFATNGKRYVGIAVTLLFFMSSCSFSFAVFEGQAGFVNAREAYRDVVVEDSDVALADEIEITPDENMLLEETETVKEYSDSDDITNMDSYTLDDILEATQNYALEDETVEESEDEIVFDSSDWRLLLVNKHHPIPEDYSFNLGTIKGSMQCDERIIADLLQMLQAAKADGINLAICSPYRNLNRQEELFENKITLYMGQGYSYMEAYKTASRTVTIPGASEHQIGLAIDIFSDTYTTLDEGFGETEAGKWLAQHSCEYGFVIRYPEDKEYITSIEYEPWHFRYVGKEAATIMTQENICLEEFWDKYL